MAKTLYNFIGVEKNDNVAFCSTCKTDVRASLVMGLYFCPNCGKNVAPSTGDGSFTMKVEATVLKEPRRLVRVKTCERCGRTYTPVKGSYCEEHNCCPDCKNRMDEEQRRIDDINAFAYAAFLK